jgi:uncharacterized protein (TIGR02147 family)
LAEVLKPSGASRGLRSRLSEFLGVQSAFISQSINGSTHFSLEHAHKISEFLDHNTEESHFFMLLVQHDRAGTHGLKKYYLGQIEDFQLERRKIQERIKVREGLDSESRQTYYSAWYYAAVHILLSIPEMQSKSALVKRLRLSPKVIGEVLEFLVSIGLAERTGDRYQIGSRRIHVGEGSPMLSKHHVNWRLQSMRALETPSNEDLHYSSVISLSRKDAKFIRESMVHLLEKVEPVLQASVEEEVYSMLLDFFVI